MLLLTLMGKGFFAAVIFCDPGPLQIPSYLMRNQEQRKYASFGGFSWLEPFCDMQRSTTLVTLP